MATASAPHSTCLLATFRFPPQLNHLWRDAVACPQFPVPRPVSPPVLSVALPPRVPVSVPTPLSLVTPPESTSPLDCCNCLSFQIVSCAKAQSQKLAQLIHEISRFISPNSCSCPARPPSPNTYLPPAMTLSPMSAARQLLYFSPLLSFLPLSLLFLSFFLCPYVVAPCAFRSFAWFTVN